MKHIALALTFSVVATPTLAQDTEDEGGWSLMGRGAQLLMEGLMQEMEPALEDLQGLAQEFGPALRDFTAQMGPALRDLLEEVEDWSVYHPPELLENGDIIIRRKTPEDQEVEPDPDAQIDI
ncbi:MAG: hypothetical protein AAGK77_11245 [Pseudomonadota bacterium]